VRLSSMSAILVMLAVLVGCDQPTEQKQKQVTPVAKAKPPRQASLAHRFTLTKFDGGVAFDTQTGQICRTWDWEPGGESAKPNAKGIVLQRSFGELTPTCISLYTQYPSGSELIVETAPEEPN
jgi:hypothetical protein